MNKITKEFLESEITSVEYKRLSERLTHCTITVKDGFQFTGESACVDPTNYDEDTGNKIAYDDAFGKMWLPYGFQLHQKIRDEAVHDQRIKGVNGEFYPCKPDIFAKTYEKVEREQAPWSRQKMHGEAGQVEKNNIEDVLPKTKYMDFGQAVRVVKNGIRVCRDGWNDKGVFLILIKGEAVVECIKWRYGDPTPNSTRKVLDSIYMCTADNQLVPWTASQTDVLAEDWQIVE